MRRTVFIYAGNNTFSANSAEEGGGCMPQLIVHLA